jgi:hypothetical protein
MTRARQLPQIIHLFRREIHAGNNEPIDVR